jgi:hypothetical protein
MGRLVTRDVRAGPFGTTLYIVTLKSFGPPLHITLPTYSEPFSPSPRRDRLEFRRAKMSLSEYVE